MTEAEKKALSSYKTPELIATYEELHHVLGADRVTYYFGDLGGHFFKYGTAEDAALAAYGKALKAIRMDSDTFQQTKDFIHRGGIIARMQSCMLEPDARLRDVMERWPGDEFDQVVHQEDSSYCIPEMALSRLTPAGQEDFSLLLDAKVEAIRAGDLGLEVVISGVEPREMDRFHDACDAHEQAEQAMGPAMG